MPFLFLSRRPSHVAPLPSHGSLARRTGLVIAGLWVWLGLLDALFVFFHLPDRLWLVTAALIVPIALMSGVLLFRLGRVVEQLGDPFGRGGASPQSAAPLAVFGAEIKAGARAGLLGGLGFGLHNTAGFFGATLGFSRPSPLDSLLVLILNVLAGSAVGIFVGVVLSAWGAWTSQPNEAPRSAGQGSWRVAPGPSASPLEVDPARSNPGWGGYPSSDAPGTEGWRRS